jgi:hypothetical protein
VRAARLSALLLCGLALLVALPACGGDEDDEDSPTIDVPAGASQSVPETATQTQPAPAGAGGGGGGGGAGGGTGAPNPAKPDTAENDLPPPPGSPQEQFEQFCNQNPGACG